jgi:hypothetical protein
MGSLQYPGSHLDVKAIGPANLHVALNDLIGAYVQEKSALLKMQEPCLPEPTISENERAQFKFDEVLPDLKAKMTALKATHLRSTGECFRCSWSSISTTLSCANENSEQASRKSYLGLGDPSETKTVGDGYSRLDAIISLAAEKAAFWKMDSASWSTCDERAYVDDAGNRQLLGAVVCGKQLPHRTRRCLRFWAEYSLITDATWKISMSLTSNSKRLKVFDLYKAMADANTALAASPKDPKLTTAYNEKMAAYNAELKSSGADLTARENAKSKIFVTELKPASADDKPYLYFFDRNVARNDYLLNKFVSGNPCNSAPSGVGT